MEMPSDPPARAYPLVNELAVDGIPVAVTCLWDVRTLHWDAELRRSRTLDLPDIERSGPVRTRSRR